MADLRVGVRLEMGTSDYERLAREAQLAERLGYDVVWVRDHLSLEKTTGDPNCLECWTVMSALARDTQRVGIGSLVLCAPFRNPALLAKMGATLDVISGGRLLFGIGAGHVKSEFDEYGFAFPTPGDRVAMLRETIQIIRLMWTEHRPTFAGRFFSIANALNEPKPIQRPTPPIMVGASKPRALRLVAELADAWNTPEGTEDYLAGRDVLARHCDAIGRDPASIRHIVRVNVIIDDTEAKAQDRLEVMLNQRQGQQYLRQRTVVGTAEQCAEHFRPLVALGVTEFIAAFWEADRQSEGIERFATEVWPLIQQMA